MYESHEIVGMESRVTQKEVAERVGISQAAVSMALRGDPRISRLKRERVAAVAAEMGYRPDPVLGALVRYRREQTQPEAIGTVAYLLPCRDQRAYLLSPFARESWEGVQAACDEMGYRCEPFVAGEMSSPRRESVWRNRGIRGVIIGPVGRSVEFAPLRSEDLAVVQIGRGWSESGYDQVTSNHFDNMRIVWRELRARGYRRIAFMYRRGDDELTDGRWLAAYLYLAQKEGEGYLAEAVATPEGVARVAASGPDAVIGTDFWLRTTLEERAGWRIPADVGFACLSVATAEAATAGILQGSFAIGRMAARLLDQTLRANEYGPRKDPGILVIRGMWREGATVRPRLAGSAD